MTLLCSVSSDLRTVYRNESLIIDRKNPTGK